MNKQTASSVFIIVLIAGIWASDSCAAEKLDLRIRLKPGQKYDMRLITELKRTETIKDKQEHESFMFARGMGFDIKQVDANGVASIKVTFRTTRLEVIRAGGYRVEYDSTKQSATNDHSEIPDIEAAGVGESFIIKITPKGKIIEIDGLEPMHARIAERVIAWEKKYFDKKGYKYNESRKKLKRHNTKAHYSEKEIKNMLSDMIMAFPDQSLAIGDAWTDKVKIWGKNNEIDGTYRLKDSEKGTIVIDLSAKRTPEEEAFSWVNNEGREVGFKLVGSCEGSFEIDQNTGWLVRSKFKTQFTGEVIDPEADNQMPEPITEQELIIVEPMGSEATAKAITQMKVWGEVVNGLRAAVEFVPEKEFYSLGEEIDGEVLGEKVGTHFYIQNVSATTVNKFQKVGQGMKGHGIVQDAEGNELRFGEFSWFMEWDSPYCQVLRHNEIFTWDGPKIDIRGYNKYGNPGRMGGSIVYCKPGQYSIRFNLTFDTGIILEPGKRELVIKAASKSDKGADVQVEIEKR
jgi:hypothetical protein